MENKLQFNASVIRNYIRSTLMWPQLRFFVSLTLLQVVIAAKEKSIEHGALKELVLPEEALRDILAIATRSHRAFGIGVRLTHDHIVEDFQKSVSFSEMLWSRLFLAHAQWIRRGGKESLLHSERDCIDAQTAVQRVFSTVQQSSDLSREYRDGLRRDDAASISKIVLQERANIAVSTLVEKIDQRLKSKIDAQLRRGIVKAMQRPISFNQET